MVTASACYKLAAQRRIGGVDPDGFWAGVIINGLIAAFPAVSRVFHAAKFGNW